MTLPLCLVTPSTECEILCSAPAQAGVLFHLEHPIPLRADVWRSRCYAPILPASGPIPLLPTESEAWPGASSRCSAWPGA